jgi:hypothetical protein
VNGAGRFSWSSAETEDALLWSGFFTSFIHLAAAINVPCVKERSTLDLGQEFSMHVDFNLWLQLIYHTRNFFFFIRF